MSNNCGIHGKSFEISGPYNFWTSVKSNIPDVWNWNFWTFFGSGVEVRPAPPPPQWLRPCTSVGCHCLGFKNWNTVCSINLCFNLGVNVETCHPLLQIMGQRNIFFCNDLIFFFSFFFFLDFLCYLLYSIRIIHPKFFKKTSFEITIHNRGIFRTQPKI